MVFKERVVYIIVMVWFKLLSLLPSFILFSLSNPLAFLLYRVFGYRKKVIIENLGNSFPDRSQKEIKEIARRYYHHLAILMLEVMFLRFVSDKRLSKMIEIENIELFDALYKDGRNIIAMYGHFGNWEYGGGLMSLTKYKGAAVYKKLSSSAFDKLYYDIRSRYSIQPVEMNDVLRKVITLNKLDPYVLFMVSDQSPMKSDRQHWIQFLNQETGVYTGSEKLARKFDMPVVYLEIQRVKKGSYKIVPTLITDKPKECQANEITEKFYALLEDSINENPHQWLWSHRRWKNKRS